MKKTILRRILAYSARTHIMLYPLFALGSTALMLYLSVLAGRVLDLMPGAGKVNLAALTAILLRMAFAAGLAAIAQWLSARCLCRAACKTVDGIRRDAFAHIQHMPLSSVELHSAAIARCAIEDANALSRTLLPKLARLFANSFALLGTLVLMLRISAGTAAAVVLVTPLPWFAEVLLFHRFREKNSLCAALLTHLSDRRAQLGNALIFACAACLGALSAVAGGATIGELACLLACASLYAGRFNEIPGLIADIRNAIACAERVFALIDAPTEDPDAEQALDPLREPLWLKSGTVRENIALARPDAAYEEIVNAAKMAHAHGFIRRMPGGYDAAIRENGIGLSESQKRLICLARAMLNPLLVTDEAKTS